MESKFKVGQKVRSDLGYEGIIICITHQEPKYNDMGDLSVIGGFLYTLRTQDGGRVTFMDEFLEEADDLDISPITDADSKPLFKKGDRVKSISFSRGKVVSIIENRGSSGMTLYQVQDINGETHEIVEKLLEADPFRGIIKFTPNGPVSTDPDDDFDL